MREEETARPTEVMGPDGDALTLDDLPPSTMSRWSVRRKAEVVAAVSGGMLSIDEACERYSLSLEEFTRWQSTLERTGMRGLRVTRVQQDRVFFRGGS
jgi:hypothetical protein